MTPASSERATPPDWWRGTTPRLLPGLGGTPICGEVRQFDGSLLPVNDPSQLRQAFFREAYASEIEITLDGISLAVCWSEFENCTFRQRSRRLNAKGVGPQGSFGNRPSIYRGCTFAGVHFKTLSGFTTGAARFVSCRFDRCRFNGHFSGSTDYIGCTFIGKLDGGVWYGTVPPGDADAGRHNVITGNDFTGVTFGVNVGWRGDIDFAAQQWPDNYQPTAESSKSLPPRVKRIARES